ncbi:MAG: 1-acyl-sn-glycerol-3-phosphate acyltransferase [Clostridia bacterium]|nr:1-acyl-sn-glycerol-3-phosphate acyltransferase [Clostridia bacterium]
MRAYAGLYKCLAGFFRRLFRVEAVGLENEPQEGGFIVAPNHLSLFDVIIVAATLKHQVHYMAKAELFKIPLLKQLITTLGAFPVDRKGSDVGAIRRCISHLQQGNVIGFYPQGHRQPGIDPAKTEAKSGIAMVAKRADAKVLPICIQTKGYRILPFRKVYLTIGAPITPEEINFGGSGKEEYDKAAKHIFDRILSLKREDIQI